jgi:hypothetical protein
MVKIKLRNMTRHYRTNAMLSTISLSLTLCYKKENGNPKYDVNMITETTTPKSLEHLYKQNIEHFRQA